MASAAAAMWTQLPASKAFIQRLGLRYPIVLAPMAGISTPSLTAAICNEGGLGMYGAAIVPLADLPGVIADTRSQLKTDVLFGINLFVPPRALPRHTDQQQQALNAVQEYYTAMAKQHSLHCNTDFKPLFDTKALQQAFEAQVQVALDAQVPVMSFYFGIPDEPLLSRIKHAGVYTMGTATCLQEAKRLQEAGIDCIVVQGAEAGGHRGTWYDTPGDYKEYMVGTTTLVAMLAAHIRGTPLLASGGIMTGQQIVAALAAGAAGVQLGTAFLTCPEAATSTTARKLLLQEPDRGTTVTQAFTSKPARGLINQATKDLEHLQGQLPLSLIGLVNARPFYAAAAKAGLAEYTMQLCGQGYPLCRESSASEVFQQLAKEAEEIAKQFSGAD